MAAFKKNVAHALGDTTLKVAIDRTTGTAERKRALALADFPQFATARERGTKIKDHVISHLDYYLETFEHNAVASGAKVHWATDAEAACAIVLKLCHAAGARVVTRAKSMLGEEIGLPHALDAAGIERVETDLAEHIVQLERDAVAHRVAGAAQDARAGFRPVQGRASPAACDRGRGSDGRERAAGIAREIPVGRCRHLRRQLPDRRHRSGVHGDQRRQR